MKTYSELFAAIEQRGKDFMAQQRHNMRATFMTAKMAGKVHDWRNTDDDAFAAIDFMVVNLAGEAGFHNQPAQRLNPAPPTPPPVAPNVYVPPPNPFMPTPATMTETELKLAKELGLDTSEDKPSKVRPAAPRIS